MNNLKHAVVVLFLNEGYISTQDLCSSESWTTEARRTLCKTSQR